MSDTLDRATCEATLDALEASVPCNARVRRTVRAVLAEAFLLGMRFARQSSVQPFPTVETGGVIHVPDVPPSIR